MPDPIVTVGAGAGVGLGAAFTAGYALKAVLGPTLDLVGEDIRNLYAAGRDKILEKAMQKGAKEGDGKASNPRVTLETFTSGCLAQGEICAEYFGGILAGCRSADGADDSLMPFLDQVKRLSAKQLHLHYIIYSALNKLAVRPSAEKYNVAQRDFEKYTVTFDYWELLEMGLRTWQDGAVLLRAGLIHSYDCTPKAITTDTQVVGIASFMPTTYGAMLYAASTGNIERFIAFGTEQFADYNNVPLPTQFFKSRKEAESAIAPKLLSEMVDTATKLFNR